MGGGLRLREQTAWRAEEKQQPHGAEVPQEVRAAACLSGPSFSPTVAEAEEGPTLPCRLGKTGDSKGLGRMRGMGKGGRRGRAPITQHTPMSALSDPRWALSPGPCPVPFPPALHFH